MWESNLHKPITLRNCIDFLTQNSSSTPTLDEMARCSMNWQHRLRRIIGDSQSDKRFRVFKKPVLSLIFCFDSSSSFSLLSQAWIWRVKFDSLWRDIPSLSHNMIINNQSLVTSNQFWQFCHNPNNVKKVSWMSDKSIIHIGNGSRKLAKKIDDIWEYTSENMAVNDICEDLSKLATKMNKTWEIRTRMWLSIKCFWTSIDFLSLLKRSVSSHRWICAGLYHLSMEDLPMRNYWTSVFHLLLTWVLNSFHKFTAPSRIRWRLFCDPQNFCGHPDQSSPFQLPSRWITWESPSGCPTLVDDGIWNLPSRLLTFTHRRALPTNLSSSIHYQAKILVRICITLSKMLRETLNGLFLEWMERLQNLLEGKSVKWQSEV